MKQVRIRDPWWRRPLVWAGVLRPRYRLATLNDLIYGDDSEPSDQFRGLAKRFGPPNA